MSPQIALIFVCAVIASLLWFDFSDKSEGVSSAIWIPFFWIFLVGTRLASRWLMLGQRIDMASYDFVEGSALDRDVFFFLILLGVYVLYKRNVRLGDLVRKNPWIFIYFSLGAVSILWSDYPFVSLKRLVKALGNVVMALVLLTEKSPERAIIAVIRRFAFVFAPLSFLFIKYFPEYGRGYHMGRPLFTGAAMGKNGLGQSSLICLIGFSWYLIVYWGKDTQKSRRLLRAVVYVAFIPLLFWLLAMSDSATSIACATATLGLFVVSRLRGIKRRLHRIVGVLIVTVVVFLVLNSVFGLTRILIVEVLGRDLTLTSRVPMWESLLAMADNRLFGAGYEGFWLGQRMVLLFGIWDVFNSHNGYLETYLNMGVAGLVLMVGSILFGLLVKVRAELKAGKPLAVFKVSLIVSAIMYNFSEAAFHGANNIWLLLLLAILNVSTREPDGASSIETGHISMSTAAGRRS